MDGKQFFDSSCRFCSFIDEQIITQESVEELQCLLLDLYRCARDLPDIEPDNIEDNLSHIEVTTIHVDLPSVYWEVYDPFVVEEPVCCSIEDDLRDIYLSLKRGIQEYICGRTNDAIWEWRFGALHTWGNHVADLIRALHYVAQ